VHFLRGYIGVLLFGNGSRPVDVVSDRQQPGLCVRIVERLGETRLVAPFPLSALQPRIDTRRHAQDFPTTIS